MSVLSTQDQQSPQDRPFAVMEAGSDPYLRVAGYLFLLQAAVWAILFLRWTTFGSIDWNAYPAELELSHWPSVLAYIIYAVFFAADLIIAIALIRNLRWGRPAGMVVAGLTMAISLIYYLLTREFYGAVFIFGLSGFLLVLLMRHAPWSLAFLSAFWLIVFFILPMLIVFMVSLGERSFRGTIAYPGLSLANIPVLFDDYVRFFSQINGQYIYLRIMGRSVWLATMNTVLCLIIGYPFAYWIAKQPRDRRPILIFLVMIPFWTNFLVRTYAWMLILRDSGLINTFWTSSLHDLASQLAHNSQFFAWLAAISENELPLLFNARAVFLGLLYGYLPFMVLPLYTNLEKLNWSLIEAAADLGANTWHSTLRVLIPLTLPGIVAGSIIVFIPSLGSYVVPDMLGGARVMMLGNLIQQQFMTARDWPFGSAIGFIMIGLMLLAIVVYFRVQSRAENPV